MKAVVIHSGGLDSSVCLALMVRQYGAEQVVSLTFAYGQRHQTEIAQAAKICRDWGVVHRVEVFDLLGRLAHSALIDDSQPLRGPKEDLVSSTMVLGRNGILAQLGALYAYTVGAHEVVLGIMEREGEEVGYRDCSRVYMDLIQTVIRIDLADPSFLVTTPVVYLDKAGVWAKAHELGLLEYLLHNTISCYAGLLHPGCGRCPACQQRLKGLHKFGYTRV